MNRLISIVVPFLLFPACTSEAPKTSPKDEGTPSEVSKLILAKDPGAAVSVVAAKQAGPKSGVVVEGRVHDITKGFAMLKLMDKEMHYCGQVNKEDKCPTPWDYCCDSKEDRVAKSLLVEARGKDGKPLTTESLPKTRLCDLFKVTGEIVKDTHGNLVLVADGLWQAERPDMPDYVKWPK